MYNNEIEKLNPGSIVQLYNIENINIDINKAIENDIDILNISTEPIKIGEVARSIFDINLKKRNNEIFRTDMKSKYGYLYDSKNQYLYSKKTLLNEIREFASHK